MFLLSLKQNRNNKFKITKTNTFGFTIIELLVVISIIGLLSTISVVSLNGARIKSRDAKRVSDIKQIKTGLDLYFNDNGVYPPNPTSTSLGIGTNLVLCDGGFKATSNVGDCPLGKIYIGKVPRNPTPNGIEYSYSLTSPEKIEPLAKRDFVV